MNDKKLKLIIKEVISEIEDITISGIGTMPYKVAKKQVVEKLKDLLSRANGDKFKTISAVNLETLIHMWLTLSAYEAHKKPPISTIIKSK